MVKAMVKIKIMNKTGNAQTYNVNPKNLKKYKKIRGIYYKKRKIITPAGKISVRPVKNISKYIYLADKKAWAYYRPNQKIKITTDKGKISVTHEQLKALYSYKKRKYIKERNVGWLKQKKSVLKKIKHKKKTVRKVASGQQIVVEQKVKIGGKTIVIKGFSKVQTRDRKFSYKEMLRLALKNLKSRERYEAKRITDDSGSPVKRLSPRKIYVIKWVE